MHFRQSHWKKLVRGAINYTVLLIQSNFKNCVSKYIVIRSLIMYFDRLELSFFL